MLMFVSMTLRSPIFFFNDTATTEISTLSLHDALPISVTRATASFARTGSGTETGSVTRVRSGANEPPRASAARSEEHTSELQSRQYLVCRLLLEQKTSQYLVFPRLNETTSTVMG